MYPPLGPVRHHAWADGYAGRVRVGVIGPPGPDMFAANILEALPGLGVEAVELGAARRPTGVRQVDAVVDRLVPMSAALEVRAQGAVAERALAAECDVIINVVGALRPQTVARLRSGGAKVALWFPDAVSNMGNQMMLLAPYDRFFFTDRAFARRVTEVEGVPAAYLPEACNPQWHKPSCDAATDPGFVSVGNMYPSRVLLFDRLLADGVPLRLYGPGFPRWLPPRPLNAHHTGRVVLRTEKARVFRGASAVLNNLHPAEGGVNCRLFEAAGSGAAVLIDERTVLPELFEVGTEALTFSDYEGLVKQCRRLLAEPELTREVGDAAARRAHQDHTYAHRLRQLLGDLG